ncbi:MAG: UvrD-helicase domain-containing protein [Blastocatellia bacterium]|nr:UvrD-helicase domain-containing protein [Blastocatellia bacterium]
MSFEIIHKPTFTNQLLVIPKEFVVQILEKIEFLRNDPSPDGKQKKKLHGYKGDVYRLRSGDFRIIYIYGDGWVALLGVDSRKDVYKGDKLIAEVEDIDISQFASLNDVLTLKEFPKQPSSQYSSRSTSKKQIDELLPVKITKELLESLLIPSDFFAVLLTCETLEDLANAKVPNELRDRLFDCIYSPNFDQVINQPSFTTNTEDLLRFKEGELVTFLLKLNPEQEKYVDWAINASGPTLLKGGPGTGKSTVALYRVRSLINNLKKQGISSPSILFTTYTNSLVAFSQQLLNNLLGKDSQYVQVKTADSIACDIIRDAIGNPNIASNSELVSLMKQAVNNTISSLEGNLLQKQAQTEILKRLSINYLLEELNSVIESRELKSLEEYLETPRNGRSLRLNKTQRRGIWSLYKHFSKLLIENGIESWSQIRSKALEILRSTNNMAIYDAVIVDEAQDLEPNTIRMLIKLCAKPNRLFITADANQSIYSNSFRWSDIHSDLQFVGRTGILKTNHRTTQEINEAAYSYLTNGLIDDEKIESSYIHSGPQPTVRAVENVKDEANLIASFCKAAAKEYRLAIGSCAVLVPSEQVGKEIAGRLNHFGLEANFMAGKDLDLNKTSIKVITLKSAKGLEFPIVTIAGFLTTNYPIIPQNTPVEAIEEILARERRSMYVAMTRAMRALLVVIAAKNTSQLLKGFNGKLWNLGEV